MRILRSLAHWITLHIARFLATRVATPLLVAMTLSLAAGGALATAPLARHPIPTAVVQTTPAFPNSSCFVRWHGWNVCHILPSQVSDYPNAYWCRPSRRYPGMDACFFWNK
jgi:hypothetical protein